MMHVERSRHRRRKRFMARGLLVLGMMILAACAGQPRDLGGRLGAEQVLNSPLRDDEAVASVADADLVGRSPAMQAFLEQHVNASAGPRTRLEQLVASVVKGREFQLDYEGATRTASETFARRNGNCLSFTSMFVALARGVALDAHFQEVDIAPDWSMSGQTFLISQHVNAVVELRGDVSRVIDFNTYDFNAESDGHRISDDRALAHYYNNQGVAHMLAGRTAAAFANFSRSLEADRGFASAWVNMGSLHRRSGLTAHAEAAYLAALDTDPANLQAMSNLADLYLELGRLEQAEYYLGRVHWHRMRNPYYRYHLAVEALEAGDYDASIAHLRHAIRKRREDHRFYYVMSLNYWMLGDSERASRWLTKAEAIAAQDANKAQYQRKLEWLANRRTRLSGHDPASNTSPTGPE